MKKKIFSMPFNATQSGEEINENFIPFIKEYGDWLYDIYFACFIPPFDNDVMGIGNVYSAEDSKEVFQFMMWCQEKYGIRASATFNNFSIEPSMENLQTFIASLKPYYEAGLRSITIPHAHWIRTGLLKEAYPDLFVKNTVVRRVYNAQEYVNAVLGGFDLVNVECSVIRDRDMLTELKAAYDKYQVPISLLVNEICRGKCPLRDEHYFLNCKSIKGTQYFLQPISSVSCSKWRQELPHYRMLVADLPHTRKGIDAYLEFVQVLKLHGRITKPLFEGSMDIVRRYAAGEEVVFMAKHEYLETIGLRGEKLKAWEGKTSNCKFDCWKCNACELVYEESQKNMEGR